MTSINVPFTQTMTLMQSIDIPCITDKLYLDDKSLPPLANSSQSTIVPLFNYDSTAVYG